jgi:hypothetical protein
MPAGPWVLVVGMHRSGTSAVTGALGQLGLSVPVREDRWGTTEDNPDYWESAALGLFNEALLERLGGTWDAPPECGAGWESGPVLAEEGIGDPAAAASIAFPRAGPVVWKDPRVCLLLPYWLAHLPQPVAAVFIWRAPLPVARSLRTRDGMHLADGVALWERYNRAGLSGLLGVDTFVIGYESILDDPAGTIGQLAGWLGSLAQFSDEARHWDLTSAMRAISPQLQRQHDTGDHTILLDEQQWLAEHLESLEGPQRPLTASLPNDESPWTTALLGDRRRAAGLRLQRDTLENAGTDPASAGEERRQEARVDVERLRAELERSQTDLARTRTELDAARQQNAEMQASTSWRVTGPLRRLGALRNRRPSAPLR